MKIRKNFDERFSNFDILRRNNMKRNTKSKKLDGNPPTKQAKATEPAVVNVNKRKSTLHSTQN